MRRLSTTLRVQRTLCIAFLAALGLTISCDRDCPTQPPPPPPPVDNGTNFYVLYRNAALNDDSIAIFVFNTNLMMAVDSFMLYAGATNYRKIAVSTDEKFLMIASSATSGGVVHIIDIDTRQEINMLTGRDMELKVSRNGKYTVAESWLENIVLDSTLLDTVVIDTVGSWGGAWDSTGNIFYGLQLRPSGTVIRRFDVEADSALPEIAVIDPVYGIGYVARLQTTANPDKVFLYIYYGQNSGRVVSYNLADSSIVFSYWIGSQNTYLAITPDWKTILFTDPENFDNWVVERSVYFVNAETDQLETIVPPPPPANGTVYGPEEMILNPSKIAVSSDGKFAMTDGPESRRGVGLISLTERKYVAFLWPDTLYVYAGEPVGVACKVRR